MHTRHARAPAPAYAGAAWLGGSGSEPQWDRRLDVEGQWRSDVEAQQHSAIEKPSAAASARLSRLTSSPKFCGHMDVDEYGDEYDSSFIQRYFGALEAFSARKTSKCGVPVGHYSTRKPNPTPADANAEAERITILLSAYSPRGTDLKLAGSLASVSSAYTASSSSA
ncbi:hypothetical protein B0H10DRAFT_2225422 [Mycena sp. CBHHK59/15]|nr:hypothetical protein B0H10DRAFT_2225422 [Mycena sp. CBHHK59/15]